MGGDVERSRDERGDGEEVVNFFVYAASTSVGQYASQLVHRSTEVSGEKIKLIGAASQKRSDTLYSPPYSYDHLVDYRESDWPEKVKELTDGKGVQYAYDSISEDDTVKLVAGTLAKDVKLAIVRSRTDPAWNLSDCIEVVYGAVWEALGKKIQYYGDVTVSHLLKGERSVSASSDGWKVVAR